MFLSSWLLFLVEPLATKEIIPVLGGAPQVWNISMVFYQFCLLAGYLLAHLILKIRSGKTQMALYGAFLLAGLIALPLAIAVPRGIDPSYAPVRYLIMCLAASLFFPFLLLSTTNTLMQGWLTRRYDDGSFNPYVLYAAGNAGSLLALVTFFALEYLFPLPAMRAIWTGGFFFFALLIFCLAVYLNAGTSQKISTTARESAASGDRPTWRRRLQWLALAFVPSGLFLSVTTYITTDIASVPLFWIVPLAIYLVTFILAFSPKQWGVDNAVTGQVTLITLVGVLLAFNLLLSYLAILHLFCLYAVALSCHGMLARRKPDPRYLSEFYLWVSVGGVLGGIFCSLLAPLLFVRPLEYPLLLICACLLRANMVTIDNRARRLRFDILYPMALGALGLWLYHALELSFSQTTGWAHPFDAWARSHLMLLGRGSLNHTSILFLYHILWATALCGLFHKRTVSFAIVIATLLFFPWIANDGRLLYIHRNFFGVDRVYFDPEQNINTFRHGNTLHGLQSQEPGKRLALTSYYGPLRKIFSVLDDTAKHEPIALVGLGIGTSLCLDASATHVDIFEINPDVVKIAESPALFTYMRDCAPAKRVIVGDARVAVAREPDEKYGLIIADAFSSDSIPVHLLTKEAIENYLRKLSPHGFIAFHISNRFFDLEPLFGAMAQALPVEGFRIDGQSEIAPVTPSRWIVFTRQISDAQRETIHRLGWKPLKKSDNRIWTDQYSNIFPYLQ